ncbi:hypothetical protein AB0873_02215 [Micromonospora sp. NPDC047707]|uniref:hypothetical protein n=1 Tax=unclassified Micromonospora TaxID=2617518 RepID=UPI0012B4D8DF|nr:hypothetical protein [Micromonospora sp. WMMC415]QGN46546.1 hypothetical protein GKC29_06645 [Micromonospora sp. WMMC415]
MSLADYDAARVLGKICGAVDGAGRWRATCNLVPGHDGPHECWKGAGTVVFRAWPFPVPAALPWARDEARP